MRLLTLVGTRPEIIRLSRVIGRLDGLCEHVLVHTGQNFEPGLSEVFFRELGVRAPDVELGVRGAGFAAQVAQIFERTAAVLEEHRPDRLLVLGDTNSGLAAIVAARLGIPVFHMEAGNRCHDERVPEEVNRRVIDHASQYCCRTRRAARPTWCARASRASASSSPATRSARCCGTTRRASRPAMALERLGVAPARFFLATLHRAENVDDPSALARSGGGAGRGGAGARPAGAVQRAPAHARPAGAGRAAAGRAAPAAAGAARASSTSSGWSSEARAVLSDSGTVQEECALLRVPNVTLRDTTERPETLECGSNVLAGATPEAVLRGLRVALGLGTSWQVPQGYDAPDVSGTVARILLGHLERRRPY